MSMQSRLNIDPQKHSVFFSYSWDNDNHLLWVERLASILEEVGIQTIYDRKDFHLGDPLPRMMEEAITKCEYILIICTPEYKKKADEHRGGVAYEDTIISAEIYEMQNHRKYIPVFPYGKIVESTPIWAKGKLGVDMSSDMKYYEGLKRLLREIDPIALPRLSPKIMYPTKRQEEIVHDAFYILDPYFQILILKSLVTWIAEKDPAGPLEKTFFWLEGIKPEMLTTEVAAVWKEALAEFEREYVELIREVAIENPVD